MLTRFNSESIKTSCFAVGISFGLIGFITLISAVGNFPDSSNSRTQLSLILSGLLTSLISAGLLKLAGKQEITRASKIFSLAVTSILSFIALSSIVYLLTGFVETLDAAIWESAAGITTTAISNIEIEKLPSSMHIYRSVSQWVGGLGVLCLVFVAMPLTVRKEDGRDLTSEGYASQIFSRDPKKKVKEFSIVYMGLTVIIFVAYISAGMGTFDSICHSLTTASTGGFSTKSASIGSYGSGSIEWVATFGMIFGGLNLGLFWWAWKKKFSKIKENTELRAYFFILLISILAFGLMLDRDFFDLETIRTAAFITASLLSTTGFTTVSWEFSSAMTTIALLVMATGAMTGSTGGGYRVHRVIMLFWYLRRESTIMHKPSAIRVMKLSGNKVLDRSLEKLHGYTAIFILLVAVGAFLLSLSSQHLTLQESISFSLSAMVTNGPGLLESTGVGIDHNVVSHLTLSALMVLGRLSILPVAYVVLFASTALKGVFLRTTEEVE